MVTREETLKEIGKAKKRIIFYIVFLILIFCVGVVLLVFFIRKGEIPALLLCIAAWAWCAVLVSQLLKTRELLKLMATHLDRSEAGGQEDDSAETDEGETGAEVTDPEKGEDHEP